MKKTRATLTLIAICWFALLQAFSPLLHAHIESDNSQQPHGIHIHGFNTDVHQDQFQHLTIAHGEAHIITVDKGTVKEDFQFLLPLLAVFTLFVASLTSVKTHRKALTTHLAVPFFHRFKTRPRAPPHN